MVPILVAICGCHFRIIFLKDILEAIIDSHFPTSKGEKHFGKYVSHRSEQGITHMSGLLSRRRLFVTKEN